MEHIIQPKLWEQKLGRDLHRHSRVEDSRQIYQNGSFVASTDSLHLNSLQLHILDFTSLLARCSILLRWKSPDPTSSSLCFIDFFFLMKKEAIKVQLSSVTFFFTRETLV